MGINLPGIVKMHLTWVNISLFRLANQTIAGFYSLCPLRPAAIVQPPLFVREPSFGQSGIDHCRRNSSAAARYDGLRRVDVLGFEDFLELRGGQEHLVVGVEQVRNGN